MLIGIGKLRKSFDQALYEAVQELPFLLQTYIGAEMDIREVSEAYRSGASNKAFDDTTAKNNGKRLRIATSRLYRSLNPKTALNTDDSVFNVRMSKLGAEVEYGTNVPYARIHEEGGTIQQNVTAKQRRFFWAMYMQSQNTMYRAMAMSNTLKIKIPKRPYFKPGIKNFEREAQPMLQERMRNRVLELMASRSISE